MIRMSKSEFSVLDLVRRSRMSVRVKMDAQGRPKHVIIEITGPAARVPSTSNSRLNFFPKRGIQNDLEYIIQRHREPYSAIRKVINKLRVTNVTSMIAPEHKIRLEAMTRLWNSIGAKPRQLICDKDNRWLVTLHLHDDLSRVDSHNLTKPVCDWLQTIGLIENDKHVDCFPTWNKDFLIQDKNQAFRISLRRMEDVRAEVQNLVSCMLA